MSQQEQHMCGCIKEKGECLCIDCHPDPLTGQCDCATKAVGDEGADSQCCCH